MSKGRRSDHEQGDIKKVAWMFGTIVKNWGTMNYSPVAFDALGSLGSLGSPAAIVASAASAASDASYAPRFAEAMHFGMGMIEPIDAATSSTGAPARGNTRNNSTVVITGWRMTAPTSAPVTAQSAKVGSMPVRAAIP